jgi:UPF0755 protein
MQSLGTILLFAILILIAGGWFFFRALTSPYKGFTEPKKNVEIRHGLRTSIILRHLQEQGLIRDPYVPLIYMKLLRRNDSIKAGVYEFDGPLSAAEVLEKLFKGDVILRSVTVREGLDRFAVGRLFVAERFGTAQQWDKLTADPDLVRDIAPEAKSLEGYLFPDTYKFNPGTPPPVIVKEMVANFRKHFTGEMAYITTGLDVHKTVTLASIVETEAKLPNERALVASVYLNRLQRHMLLGADPTVIYAIKLAGRWDGNIHKADLQIDSAYNTYRSARSPIQASPRSAPRPPRPPRTTSTSSQSTTARTRSHRTSRSTTGTSRSTSDSGIGITRSNRRACHLLSANC